MAVAGETHEASPPAPITAADFQLARASDESMPLSWDLPPSSLAFHEPPRRNLGFGCCISSRKPPEALADKRQVWDTANLGWWDFARRKMRTMSLMKTIYNRTRGLEQKTSKMEEGPEVDALWEDIHKTNAKEMREHCENEKGLLVKACQFMSMLSGTLPDAYPAEFQVLNDELPVSSIQEVKRVIFKDLGKTSGEIFESFDQEPIASASIAQVHRARLRGSQEVVAVKVQHEGVDRVFLEDVGTLSTIAAQVAYWSPNLNFTKLLQEWSESLPRELNFAEERRALERASSALKLHGNPCVVPTVHRKFTGRYVLVMEFIDADPISKLGEPEFCEKNQLDKRAILRSFLDAFGIMAFKDGLFHADPHVGNVRLLLDKSAPGGARPVLLDWGFFRELTDSERIGMAKVFHCMANYDMTGLFDVLAHLGYKFKPETMTDDFRRGFLERARSMMKDTVNKQTTRDEVMKAMKDYKARIEKEEKEGGEAQYSPMHFLEEWPRCVVFFMRMLQIVRGLCIRVDAVNMPVLDIFAQHAREALVEASTRESLVRSVSLFTGREALQPPEGFPKTSGLEPVELDNVIVQRKQSQAVAPAKFAVSRAAALEDRLQKKLAALKSEGRIVGVQVAVAEGEKLICDVSEGTLSSIDARPVESDTHFPLLGAVSGITALALVRTLWRTHKQWNSPASALQRALHVPVCSMWPQISRGASKVTLSEVLCHSAGVQDLFPMKFGPNMLDNVAAVCSHFEEVELQAKDPKYAFLLQAFLLTKLGDVVAGKDNLLHWLGAELGPLGLDIAAPTGSGGEASVCRDLPGLSRVSMTEVSQGQERRKKKTDETAAAASTPESNGNQSDTQKSSSGKCSRTLFEALAFDPLTFDPLQANTGHGGCFRAGLSLGVSAKGLAVMMANRDLQKELEALNALEPRGTDTTAIGWLLTGGASQWTAGGQQVFNVRGGLLTGQQHGFGVSCGLGPCVVHFPGLGQDGVTVAVMLNDVLHGREVAAELFKEVLSTYGYSPAWPEMPLRVIADAVQLSKSHEAQPLLDVVGGLDGLQAKLGRLKAGSSSSSSTGTAAGCFRLISCIACGCRSDNKASNTSRSFLDRLGACCIAICRRS